jgi:hypothetical protein
MKNQLKNHYENIVKSEWNYKKNNELGIYPQDITYSSNKKIWWICHKYHEWQRSPNSRKNPNSICPYCSGRKACKDNCLSTTHPDLAKEWHPTKNKNLTPENTTYLTSKKIWWKCAKGHEYMQTTNNRSGNRTYGCPYCSGKIFCKDCSLSATHPDLAKEWHLTKNKNLTPDDVSRSQQIKVWWMCSKGHEWKTSIALRSCGRKCICPTCATANRSGKNHPNYNPNLTNQDRLSRRDIKECVIWRKEIFVRDDYTCRICDVRGGPLVSHHLMGWRDNPDLRFDNKNGVTICKNCHLNFHKIYGKGSNTLQQFIEYKRAYNISLLAENRSCLSI